MGDIYRVCYIDNGEVILYPNKQDIALYSLQSVFIYVGDLDNILKSLDNLTGWTNSTLDLTYPYIAHGNDITVISNSANNTTYPAKLYTSNDNGINWQDEATVDYNSGVSFITYCVDRFYGIGVSGLSGVYSNIIKSSVDGITWSGETTYEGTLLVTYRPFASSNDTVVLITSTKIYYNVNRIGWQSYNNSFYNQHTTTCAVGCACYGDGKWVAIHNGSGSGHPYPGSDMIWYNTDITNSAGWVACYQATLSTYGGVPIAGIVYGNSGFLSGGDWGGNIGRLLYSSNGTTWDTCLPSQTNSTDMRTIGYGNGTYVCLYDSDAGRVIDRSIDMTTWANTYYTTGVIYRDVTFCPVI